MVEWNQTKNYSNKHKKTLAKNVSLHNMHVLFINPSTP